MRPIFYSDSPATCLGRRRQRHLPTSSTKLQPRVTYPRVRLFLACSQACPGTSQLALFSNLFVDPNSKTCCTHPHPVERSRLPFGTYRQPRHLPALRRVLPT